MNKDYCLECKTDKDLDFPLSCSHIYCTQCLCRRIFTNHINEFRDCELIKVKCRCDSSRDNTNTSTKDNKSNANAGGFIDLNFQQIYDMLKKTQIIDSNEKKIKNCFYHPTEANNYFCRSCNFCICNLCFQAPEHKDHIKISNEDYIKKLQSFIETLPLKSKDLDEFLTNFDKLHNEFKTKVEDCLDKSLRNIDEIIQNLNSLKNEYKKIIKKKLEKGVLNLKILKHFYSSYYHCYRNREETKDVNVLVYLKDIKYELENIQVHQTFDLPKKLNNIKELTDEMKKSPQDVFDIQFIYKRLNLKFSKVGRLTGHKEKVFTAIQLRDGRICTGSDDYTIRFWQEIEGEFKNTYTIDEFTGKVIALLQLKDERIISSSSDSNTNKIWVFKSNNKYNCDYTLAEHQKPVTALIQLSNDLLITASYDKTIKVWSITGDIFKCIQTLTEHSEAVYTVCELKDNQFASGGDDSKIRIWSLNENTREYYQLDLLKGHQQRVRSIALLSNGDIASGGDDLCLRIWKRIEESEGNGYDYLNNANKDNGNGNDEVMINKKAYTCLKIVSSHKYPITCVIQMKDKRIITASKDKTIQVWEFNSVSGWGIKEILTGHNHIVFGLLQLFDGRLLSVGGDLQAIIWKSGKLESEG